MHSKDQDTRTSKGRSRSRNYLGEYLEPHNVETSIAISMFYDKGKGSSRTSLKISNITSWTKKEGGGGSG
jgi:nanoRNase/pAp phosphatase (c-di-AMP/oligoRNAs hydrolase)